MSEESIRKGKMPICLVMNCSCHAIEECGCVPTGIEGKIAIYCPKHLRDALVSKRKEVGKWETNFIEQFGYLRQDGYPVVGSVLVFIRQLMKEGTGQETTLCATGFKEGRRQAYSEIESVIEGMKHILDEKVYSYSEFADTHNETDGYNLALTNLLSTLQEKKNSI